MQYILWYVILLMLIFLVLYIVEFIIPDKKDTLGSSKVFNFITKKYNLQMTKNRVRLLSKIIVVVNAFIISIPVMIVLFIDLSYVEALLIALIIFVPLILISYNLVGIFLKKKGW